ncbi:MAG: methionyl-tRNA formyltransferase [Candidatus Omnitrophica bacterium]|nr:methionyl-tRNA formyltransferase [Candidatus Omnitrophota bacterium]
MRIVFFGTGEFGLPSLGMLAGSRHEITAVVTRPDRRKGRGMRVKPSPVKKYILDKGIKAELLQPADPSDKEFQDTLRQKQADLFIVIDYGKFLSVDILKVPEGFCLNLHPSLLPEYRGASPVNYAILDGRRMTGNTVFRMDRRMDAGDIILRERLEIRPEDDAVSLSRRLSEKGALLLMSAIDLIEKGAAVFTPQDDTAATFAPRLDRKMAKIDWSAGSEQICRKVRGLKPWPGTFTRYGGKALKIIEASADQGSGKPGEILSTSPLVVAAGKGAVKIDKVHPEGKKAMDAGEYIKGARIEKGDELGG